MSYLHRIKTEPDVENNDGASYSSNIYRYVVQSENIKIEYDSNQEDNVSEADETEKYYAKDIEHLKEEHGFAKTNATIIKTEKCDVKYKIKNIKKEHDNEEYNIAKINNTIETEPCIIKGIDQIKKELDSDGENNTVENNDTVKIEEHDVKEMIEHIKNEHISNEERNIVIELGSDPRFFKSPEKMELPNEGHFIRYIYSNDKRIKVWECGMCNKNFKQKFMLVRHISSHTDERRFACEMCGKTFRTIATLNQHYSTHSEERPHVCEICKKSFGRSSTLISHRKIHYIDKPYKCHMCSKAFHQKGNLQNHIFSHANVRPYVCKICTRGFNQRSNLVCHIKRTHKRVKPQDAIVTLLSDIASEMDN